LLGLNSRSASLRTGFATTAAFDAAKSGLSPPSARLRCQEVERISLQISPIHLDLRAWQSPSQNDKSEGFLEALVPSACGFRWALETNAL
jgi:hypothetical protein